MQRDRIRRVLGVINGQVVYSTGGDKNGMCKLITFERWIIGAVRKA